VGRLRLSGVRKERASEYGTRNTRKDQKKSILRSSAKSVDRNFYFPARRGWGIVIDTMSAVLT
jgi:hypothetical protein